jgi:hemolysin activation/secretion protein
MRLAGLVTAVCLTLALLPAHAQPADAAASGAVRFAIHEFEIEGNSVLSVTAVEAAVLPFMGDERQLDDVEKAREALEKAYQLAGYLSVFVDVPEQRVDQGLVRLRVTEGRIERLRVTGSRYYDQGVIRERVSQLAPGTVPDFNEVQRQIAAASRDGRQLQPVLRPGLLPGTVEAELKVADELPLGGSLELNNRHAPQTDDWRVQATLRYDNLFQRDHSMALTAITAPREPQQSKVFIANYSAPLGDGDTLVAYGVVSDSLVEPLGASVVGKGTTLGARWLHSFYRGDSSHSVGLGADYKDLDQRTDQGDENAVTNPLRYLPLQATYSGSWPQDAGLLTLNTSFVFGLRGLFLRSVDCTQGGNVGRIDQFHCSREGADGGFAYWRGDLHHVQPMWGLPGTLALRLGWQLASERLVSGEQYAIGGADTVRGYLEAEGSGDHALLGSMEWRSPNLLGGAGERWLSEASVLAFIDAARAYVMHPSAGVAARVPLLGSGVGLRVRAAKHASAEIDIAWPHKATDATPDNDPRWHLRLLAQF